jgi:hypothetical protein
MATWSTLHIFQYNEIELAGEDFNKKVLTSELTKVQAVIDNIYSFKPEEITSSEEYYTIHILNNNFSICTLSDANTWKTDYAKLDATAIEELVAEIEAYTSVAE